MIHVRNLVKSRGDSKNASSGLASASVSLSSGQRILVLDPKDGSRKTETTAMMIREVIRFGDSAIILRNLFINSVICFFSV